MATPKLDRLCINFVKRIPDQLVSAYTPGTGALPRSYLLEASTIIDYVNRAMHKLFQTIWVEVAGDTNKFLQILPELGKISGEIPLASGQYLISAPYLDFFKLVGCYDGNNLPIKVKSESYYTQIKAGKYKSFQIGDSDPAIFQINNLLEVVPNTAANKIIIHYIKFPVDPNSGTYLVQDGNEDVPYKEIWDKEIVDIAYKLFLEETVQTQ